MHNLTPHIEVRTVHSSDAIAIDALDHTFETDRIYTLRVQNSLSQTEEQSSLHSPVSFAFELLETPVDPPLYKDYRLSQSGEATLYASLICSQNGYVALADNEIAGCILLNVDTYRSIVHIENLLIGRPYRRYGVGSLLLNCAADWAREHDCWAVTLETQNVNFPAIQFYLRNDFSIWSIQHHFYPPGPTAHEVAIIMGKRLTSTSL